MEPMILFIFIYNLNYLQMLVDFSWINVSFHFWNAWYYYYESFILIYYFSKIYGSKNKNLVHIYLFFLLRCTFRCLCPNTGQDIVKRKRTYQTNSFILFADFELLFFISDKILLEREQYKKHKIPMQNLLTK